jgi:hypothetical protein
MMAPLSLPRFAASVAALSIRTITADPVTVPLVDPVHAVGIACSAST